MGFFLNVNQAVGGFASVYLPSGGGFTGGNCQVYNPNGVPTYLLPSPTNINVMTMMLGISLAGPSSYLDVNMLVGQLVHTGITNELPGVFTGIYTSDTTEYRIYVDLTNSTGVTLSSMNWHLGFGVGASFVESGTSDFVDWAADNSPAGFHSAPFVTSWTGATGLHFSTNQTIWSAGQPLVNGQSRTFVVSVDMSDGYDAGALNPDGYPDYSVQGTDRFPGGVRTASNYLMTFRFATNAPAAPASAGSSVAHTRVFGIVI